MARGFALAKCPFLTEDLDYGQTKAQGLAGASEIAHNQILLVPDASKSFVLHWEERVNASFPQSLHRLGGDLGEVREVTWIVSSRGTFNGSLSVVALSFMMSLRVSRNNRLALTSLTCPQV